MGLKKKIDTENENERLSVISEYELDNEGIIDDLQCIVELASSICEVPASLISVVGGEKQWFRANVGNPFSSTSKEHSFCQHTIKKDELFQIPDARKDSRFKDNPLVLNEPKIIFYAGFPIKINNHNIATLCVHDNKPRKLSEEKIKSLELLTNQAAKLIELRGNKIELAKRNAVIEERNNALNESLQMNKQLLSLVSHDIRGPIGSILTFFKGKRGAVDEDEMNRKFIPLMKTSLKGIYDTIGNMLEWSNNINKVNTEDINLYLLVEELIRLFASQMEQKKNRILNKLNPELTVKGDKAALQFIIRNLIGNAMKFTQSGEITVEAQTLGERVNISVSDTGVGISEIMIKKILNKDRKVSTSGTQNEKGSGMGLNFIQQFLHKMNSDLKIVSKEGEGSTFSFSVQK